MVYAPVMVKPGEALRSQLAIPEARSCAAKGGEPQPIDYAWMASEGGVLCTKSDLH